MARAVVVARAVHAVRFTEACSTEAVALDALAAPRTDEAALGVRRAALLRMSRVHRQVHRKVFDQ
eukprot:4449323-Prymnesium_polylepis.2